MATSTPTEKRTCTHALTYTHTHTHTRTHTYLVSGLLNTCLLVTHELGATCLQYWRHLRAQTNTPHHTTASVPLRRLYLCAPIPRSSTHVCTLCYLDCRACIVPFIHCFALCVCVCVCARACVYKLTAPFLGFLCHVLVVSRDEN